MTIRTRELRQFARLYSLGKQLHCARLLGQAETYTAELSSTLIREELGRCHYATQYPKVKKEVRFLFDQCSPLLHIFVDKK